MSLTITGLIGTILALILTPEETSAILSLLDQVLLVAGILLTYYGRYRVGDITWYGTRK